MTTPRASSLHARLSIPYHYVRLSESVLPERLPASLHPLPYDIPTPHRPARTTDPNPADTDDKPSHVMPDRTTILSASDRHRPCDFPSLCHAARATPLFRPAPPTARAVARQPIRLPDAPRTARQSVSYRISPNDFPGPAAPSRTTNLPLPNQTTFRFSTNRATDLTRAHLPKTGRLRYPTLGPPGDNPSPGDPPHTTIPTRSDPSTAHDTPAPPQRLPDPDPAKRLRHSAPIKRQTDPAQTPRLPTLSQCARLPISS
jgi:hypothetical protein